MDITDLKACHELVWGFRKEMMDKWPSPGERDAYRFAWTEQGEALDAWLRCNPTYNRNHSKNIDVGEEMVHCAMMLLTALGAEFDWNSEKVKAPWVYWQESYQVAVRHGYQGTVVDYTAYLVACALQESLWEREEEGEWYFIEFCGVQALVIIGEMDEIKDEGLYQRIEKELGELRARLTIQVASP